MGLPFCILKLRGEGSPRFVEAAQTLDGAKKRVTAMAESWPGEYVIFHKRLRRSVILLELYYEFPKSKRTKGRWVVTRACRKTAFRHFGVHIPKNAIYSGSTQATSPGLFTEISEFPIPSLAP